MSTPTAPPPRPAMTPKEACDHLRVSRRTLQRLTTSGRLPHTAIGARTIRFRPEDVERFLANAGNN